MEELFHGSITTSVVYPCEVVKKVLKQNAAALIFVHNHPSGNLNPSEEDIKITKKLQDAVTTINVKVHDHFIIAGNNYYSFADNNLNYFISHSVQLATVSSKLINFTS